MPLSSASARPSIIADADFMAVPDQHDDVWEIATVQSCGTEMPNGNFCTTLKANALCRKTEHVMFFVGVFALKQGMIVHCVDL